MNYMNEIFWRTDIQQIREFLLHGVEKLNIDTRTYKERIRRGYVDSFVSPHEAAAYPAKFRRLHT